MLRLLGWATAAVVSAFLLWQTISTQPFLSRTISAVLLALVSALTGMRIAAESAAAYMRTLQQVNKTLGDHNRELEEANALLLKQVSDDLHASS